MFRKDIQMIIKDRYPNSNFHIYRLRGDKMYTTIPLDENGIHIYLSPLEEVKVTFDTNGMVYLYQVRFKTFRHVDGEVLCEFDMIDSQVVSNFRKEKRTYVHYSGFYLTNDNVGPVTILDLSDSGMRIESEHPILDREIEIQYTKDGKECMIYGEIVWNKRSNQGFQYGLRVAEPSMKLAVV